MFNKNQDIIYSFRFYKKKFFKLLIYLIVIFTIVFNIYIFSYQQIDLKFNEKIQILFASLIVISFLLVIYQVDTQIDWNRRQFTSTDLKQFISDNSNARAELNELMNYSSRIHRENEKPFTVEEIHNLICEYDEETKDFKKMKNDINGPCIMTENGKKIRRNMIRILNNFEQIASNIFHGSYDEDISKNLLYKSVIQNYKLYHIYIEHLRGPKHYNDKHALENFEWLANKWQTKIEKKQRDSVEG